MMMLAPVDDVSPTVDFDVAPSSPTSVIETGLQSSSCKEKRAVEQVGEQVMRKRIKKCVSFQPDVKVHDGMSPRNVLIEGVLVRYFVHRHSINMAWILDVTQSSPRALTELLDDLKVLIARLSDGDETVPMLIRGGSKGYKLTAGHLPYLQSMQHLAEKALRTIE